MANEQDLYNLIMMNALANQGMPPGPYVSPVGPDLFPSMTRQIGDQLASTGSQTDTNQRPSAYDEPLETRAEEEYWKHLSNIPRRKEPGKWRRLGAALATLKPGQTQERIEDLRYPGFRQEVEDWTRMQGALQTPMIQERLENQGIRTARRWETAAQTQANRLAETTRHNQAMEQIRREAQGGSKVVMVRGGNIHLLKNGQLQDTGINSGLLTETDKIVLQANEIEDRVLQAAMLGNQNELEQIIARGEQARLTKQTIPGAQTVYQYGGTQTATPPTVAEQRARQIYNIDFLLQRYPNLSQFLRIGNRANGIWTLDQPSAPGVFSPGLTQEQYDAILEAIETGSFDPKVVSSIRSNISGPQPQPNQPTPAPTPPQGTQAQPPRPGMIRVRRKSDGQLGWANPGFDTNLYEAVQ
jgi:hypothetical protein